MTTYNIMLSSINDVKNFVNIVNKYEFDIDLISDRYVVDAKSIMGIFSLDLTRPLNVVAYCDDNEQFLDEIKGFIYTENVIFIKFYFLI